MGEVNLYNGELIVDNFAGGGGASCGIEAVLGACVDIAINHDPDAIAMHRANHPETRHYCESVWDIDPREAVGDRPVGLAWFSPDCKHFSKAKGGKPVDKNIRGLAWVAVRWAATVKPRVIILENVEEFKTWGPVRNGQPIKAQSGRTFNCFVNALKANGYTVDWRELRACDFGAPTIRKRFFLVARCDGRPIVWPEPTHGDPKAAAVKSGRLKPWRAAAEIIDWSIPCKSIFERERPLAENTMRRIARGLKKFVMDNPEPFIVHYKYDNQPESIKQPLSTVTSVNGHYIVTPYITKFQQNSNGQEPEHPLDTVMAGATRFGVIAPSLIQYHGEQSETECRGQTLLDPLMTVDSSPRYGLIEAFMCKHYGGGYTGKGNAPTEPINTVTSRDHQAIVTSHLIKMKGTNIGQAASEPLQTITAGGLHFGEVRAFLLKYYGRGTGQDCGEPLHTITGHDTFGLVSVMGEQYQIADIGMRMLEPRELFLAQGFPEDYIIERDYTGKAYAKSKQVARCGNAVPPPLAEALVRENMKEAAARTATA